MANTFVLIEAKTLGSAVASISFTGLGSYSSTYTDLLLLSSARGTRAADNVNMLIGFNSSTSNFSDKFVYGDGSSAGSASSTRLVSILPAATTTSSTFSNDAIYIPNFSSSNYKSFSVDTVGENNSASAAYQALIAQLWSDTSAITSIDITVAFNDLATNSTFYLYGIKNS